MWGVRERRWGVGCEGEEVGCEGEGVGCEEVEWEREVGWESL